MPHHKFPYNYWKDEQGPERARVIMGNWIRELGLDDAAPDVLYQRLSHAEFRKRGLAGMLMQVYGGRKSAAILDYLQTAPLKMEASSYPIEAITPRRFQTHRLSLRFLGGVEVTIDGVRVEGLERPGRLCSVLCLLALYRYGLRPERLSALLSGENSLPDLRLREIALIRPPGAAGATGAGLEVSSWQAQRDEPEQGQEQTVIATMEARETREAREATAAAASHPPAKHAIPPVAATTPPATTHGPSGWVSPSLMQLCSSNGLGNNPQLASSPDGSP